MTVFLSILSAILLFGMIGEKDKGDKMNFTIAFVTCIIGIIVLRIL